MSSNGFARVIRAMGFGSEAKSVSLSDPAIHEIFDVLPTASGVSVTAATAMRVPAVLHAIRLISETLGSLPCKLYREGDEGKEADKDHPAYKITHNRANDWTSAGQLRIDLTADALTFGAGYAQVVRVGGDDHPAELHRLPPQSVQRKFADDGEPFYLVRTSDNRERRLSYRDVLYLPAFGGVSPITLGKEAIGVAMTLERHASQFFVGGARPSGIIRKDAVVGKGDAEAANSIANIKNSFRRWRDASNGDPLILHSGWNYAPGTMNGTDAQFIENRIEQINEVARIFGIPPTMLYQLDRGTWANAFEMREAFMQLCLRPWLDKWQDAYATVLLTDDERDDRYFEFVIDDLQRADIVKRTDSFGKLVAMRAMTPNEVRASMNLPAIEGGDQLANPHITPGNPASANDNAPPNGAAA